MATFIIRPEINSAEVGDYERLHDVMYTKEIYKVIKLSDGTWRDLPTGTYRAEFDNSTVKEVFDIAVAALKQIGKTNSPNKRDYELIVFNNESSYSDLKLNTDKRKLPPGTR